MVKSSDSSSKKKQAKDLGFYSVSSTAGSRKSVTFTLPNFKGVQQQLRRPENGRMRTGLAVLVLVVLVFASGFTGAWLQDQRNGSELLGGTLTEQRKIVTSQSQLISQIAKTVGPSVVSVNVSITTEGTDNGFYGFSRPQSEQAAGTGIIISSDGIILTNRHVVPDGTTRVSVTLNDGTELKNVSVLGRTSDSDTLDVAFLKVGDSEGHKLTPAAIGDSSKVAVGDDVVAIGNALGQFQNTVTSGIISGYGRSVQAGSSDSGGATENLDNLFQTDAAINEGNSGGPLVNLNGQVIGINTAIAGNAQNIGFAIPINDVRGLITQVLKGGKFERPYLGVRYIPLTADIAEEYGLKTDNGAFVAPSNDPNSPSVIPDGPAAAAGLEERDVITKVDGKTIDQSHSLVSLLNQFQPGDKVKLTVLRGGDTKEITVTLGVLPASS